MRKLDSLVDKLVVYRHSKGHAQPEREDHTSEGNGGREANVALDDDTIDLEPYKEKEETETNVGDEVEERLGLVREYMLCEAGYATWDG